MLQSTINKIKENLLFVLDEVISSRQYLNKHFQNSMNNYFLENYATLPCLKKRFDTQSGRQVRKEIFEKYNAIQEVEGKVEGNLKCFLIMRGFIEEHKLNNSLKEYRASLIQITTASTSDITIKQGSSEWISLQWRRLFALMVLHHTYYPQIQGVYELWFHVFDERLIARERQKKKKEEIVYEKGKTPYIIDSKVEETEQPSSPLLNQNETSMVVIRKHQSSLSSIFTDEQHTQCSINSPQTSPSLLNIENNNSNILNQINTDAVTVDNIKMENNLKLKKYPEEEDAYEPAASKKRFTEDTIVLHQDTSNSTICSASSYSSFNSSDIQKQQTGKEQVIDINLQKLKFDLQDQFNQQPQQNQQSQSQQNQQQYSQLTQVQNFPSFHFAQNSFNNYPQDDQTSNYQSNQLGNNQVQNSIPQNNIHTVEQKYEESQNISHCQNNEFLQMNNSHQFYEQQFSYPFASQNDQYLGQMQRQSSYSYQQSSSSSSQESYQYAPFDDQANNFNNYTHPYGQQSGNQGLMFQTTNNLVGGESHSDYFLNCNQVTYMNSQNEESNEDYLNKLKFESQSNFYTSHNNLENQNNTQQFHHKVSEQSQSYSSINRHNSIHQYAFPMNFHQNQNQYPLMMAKQYQYISQANYPTIEQSEQHDQVQQYYMNQDYQGNIFSIDPSSEIFSHILN